MELVKYHRLAMRLLGFAGTIVISSAPATHAEGADRPEKLETLLSSVATDCKPTSSLQNLLDDLVTKYIFDGRERKNIPLRIPADVKDAFGKPVAIDKKTWTAISIPLAGQFHGLTTKKFTFDAGHSNEIYMYSVVFSDPVSTLKKTLGLQIHQWDEKLTQAARAGHDEGFAPNIQAADAGGSRLVCEFSD